ncbi:hypothetical protein Ae201684P_021714 [Aphanomyces euteiches]|uniref:GPI transamidase component PIG-T n=1 Tax=Aphanomyces euteiches TaxID=100861 RepID=A0A6G0WSY4_9STRA|nr:hypothetical protein Ae201684_012018 [Aphanomyces euteiches]KAH9055974.1 hypothetical protein Ae201684P_021714 [Aphanomyces euteiches]KAH9154377.1 hypothetical protein AeRB84_003534 [Aphanomyces euteiches]
MWFHGAVRAAMAVMAAGVVSGASSYTEDLTIRPLPHVSKVAAHFSFELTTSTNGSTHFDVFPKSIRQVIQKYGVDELHLTFTSGLWRHAQWGSVLGNGPYGVSLQATLQDPSQWTGLTQQLAGLISASLNKLDASTVYPLQSSPSTLHGMLPREELCTENLSPWIKLLPCRAHAGLGGWIRPLAVLDSDFLSMALHVSNEVDASGQRQLRLRQTLTVVRRVKSDWTLASLLDISTSSVCPVAQSSLVTTELFTADASSLRAGASVLYVSSTDDSIYHHVMPLESITSSLSQPWLTSAALAPLPQAYFVSGHRYLTGFGQIQGGIGLRLANTHPTDTIRVSYHESMPWYLKVYFSTVKISVNGEEVDPLTVLHIVPSVQDHPYELSFQVDIAPQSQVLMAYSFDKAFLPMGLHPPDANRGFDVPAASWTAQGTTLFTEPLLVPLPTPDFSMPYNVIVLTSTVVAMSFGIIINALLRHERKTNNLTWLLQKIGAVLSKVTKKDKID